MDPFLPIHNPRKVSLTHFLISIPSDLSYRESNMFSEQHPYRPELTV